MGGLGKGLGSLLGLHDLDEEEVVVAPKKEEVKKDTDSKNDILYLNVNSIDVNPNQPRRTFDEESLKELATSIKQYGVVQPILVRKMGDRYMIVAGERRYRASRMANLSTIPAIVREYTDAEVKEIALLENIQRQDLNPIETAKAMRELMDEYSWTQEDLADRLGKSRSNVANTLRLLNLSNDVLKLVESGKLSQGHARALVVIEDDDIQLKLATLAVEERITVRDMEQAVKELQEPYVEEETTPKKAKKVKTSMSIEMKDLIDKMQRKFATKVSVKGDDKKGQIIIDYYNTDDLDRLFQIINKI